MSTPVTAETIAAALKRQPTPDEVDSLQRAIGEREIYIRARLAAITEGSRPEHDGTALRNAKRDSVAAVRAIEAERAELTVEQSMLRSLISVLLEARERALDEQAKRAVPAAAKAIPNLAVDVRQALMVLDASVEKLNAQWRALGEFRRVGKYPFTDDELAEQLRLGDEVGKVRHVTVAHPVPAEGDEDDFVPSTPPLAVPAKDPISAWPQSWPLLYVNTGGVVRRRRAPQPAEEPSAGLPEDPPTLRGRRVVSIGRRG